MRARVHLRSVGRLLVVGVGVGLALAACGGPDAPSGSAPSTTQGYSTTAMTATTVAAIASDGRPDLDGLRFTLAGITGYVPSGATYVGLHFDSGELTVSVGCNILTAPYVLDGHALNWSAEPATDLTCDDGVAIDEARLRAFLLDGAQADVEGGVLELTADGISLSFTQIAPTPFEETRWRLGGTFVDGRVTDVPSGDRPMLVVDAAGLARFSTQCDNGTAIVERTGQRITFSNARWEGRSCTQETTMSAALEAEMRSKFQATADGEVTYEIGAEELIIRKDDRGLIFRREA